MDCSKCGFDNAASHKFCCECGTSLIQVAKEAERRSLTVMFCDLAGSTALSEQYDPEILRQIIAAYQDCCRVAINQYGGFIARYMGDGLLIYFGYPLAHEDDAQRAIRAALDIIKTVPKLKTNSDNALAVRVGIATGDVIIGDNIGEGAAEEVAVLGLTPNLAARLQSVAGENEIVIGETTRQRLDGIVTVDDLGCFTLKGISAPVQAWQVGTLSNLSRHFMSSAAFVGREDIFEQFRLALKNVKNGNLEIIHIIGQAGIGKTRLLDEFLVRNQTVTSEIWSCSAFHSNVPLHLLPAELTSLIASKNISGQSQRQFAFDAITEHLQQQAENIPFVLCIEDAHWIDPTAIEYLSTLQQRLENTSLLVVVASRPGDVADHLATVMGGKQLKLTALHKEESHALIKSLLGEGADIDACKKIVDRAGGMPLFLEELANVVVNVEDGDIPDSLQESLLARLDGLGEAKRLAQLAAIFGRTFSLDNLSFLLKENIDIVAPKVKSLKDKGVFIEVNGSYSFRHALMQEVAYDTLLLSTRSRLHGEIADWLIKSNEKNYNPELIARHLDGAKRYKEAIPYWCQAARHFAGLWAHEEAVAYYQDALEYSKLIEDQEWELSIRLDYVDSLRIIDAYDCALVQLNLSESLCKNVGLDEDWLRLHVLRGNILFPLGQTEECIVSHQSALECAKKLNNPEAEARALSGIGDALFLSGRFISAEAAFNSCVTIAEENNLDNIVLSNISLRGHMRLYLCRIEEAEDDCRQAIKMASDAGNRRAELTARGSCLGKILFETDRLEEANEAFGISSQVARDLGAHRFEALNLAFQGKIAVETGASRSALTLGKRAVAIARKSGPKFCLPIAIGVVARAEENLQACKDALAEGEAIIAAGCLAHNPLWFYRDAALTAISHGWIDKAKRYAQLLRDAFSVETTPWVELNAAGIEGLVVLFETGNKDALLSVIARAKAAGLYSWVNILKRVGEVDD